jgi:protease I
MWRLRLSTPLRGSSQMTGVKSHRIAVLATDGFEQSELVEPVKALRDAGAIVQIVAPKGGEIQGMKHKEKGDKTRVDLELSQAKPEDFDALVLPGGVANPDELRTNTKAVEFVKHFIKAGKPVATICHGPWTLVEADAVRGKTVTSWPSLRTDLKNAGANWVDKEVVVDGNLVTSRKPDDLPAFNRELLAVLSKEKPAQMRKAG